MNSISTSIWAIWLLGRFLISLLLPLQMELRPTFTISQGYFEDEIRQYMYNCFCQMLYKHKVVKLVTDELCSRAWSPGLSVRRLALVYKWHLWCSFLPFVDLKHTCSLINKTYSEKWLLFWNMFQMYSLEL